MPVTRTIQSDTTQVAFAGRPLLTGSVVELAMSAAADYVNGTGITLTAAQAGLTAIFHAWGYVRSSTGAFRGFLPVWDAAAGAVKIVATGAGNQAAFSEIATSGVNAGDVIVLFVIGF